MTLDRYARERGVVPVPAIDVDASVTSVEDLGKLRTKFRDILRCFDHPKFIHLGPKITSILVKKAMSTLPSNRYSQEKKKLKKILKFPKSVVDPMFVIL